MSKFTIFCLLLITLSAISCSDDKDSSATIPPVPTSPPLPTPDCSTCTYVVPANVKTVDGSALDLPPGAKICLDATITYGDIRLINIEGTSNNPVLIVNCGGPVTISPAADRPWGIKTEMSRHFRISGTGDGYGITITGGTMGVTLDNLSTNFEVDHLEIRNSGFAGIMAKTDPSCDNATVRGNFIMSGISLHDNYVHQTKGEAFYVGNSFYKDGMNIKDCGVRYPHEIHGVKIYNNIIKRPGWDGIQLNCAVAGAEVYNNRIEDYGFFNQVNQNIGIAIGAGTGGRCYNNFIMNGSGNGMTVLGLGDNVVYNNIIVNAGEIGIYCDERVTPGPGFKFINNNIINPAKDGIRLSADEVPMNVVINNIIVNPGNYPVYEADATHRTGNDAYVFVLSNSVKVDLSNNYFTNAIGDVKFINAASNNFGLAESSPVIDEGKDVRPYDINIDFLEMDRLKGEATDIGAIEF